MNKIRKTQLQIKPNEIRISLKKSIITAIFSWNIDKTCLCVIYHELTGNPFLYPFYINLAHAPGKLMITSKDYLLSIIWNFKTIKSLTKLDKYTHLWLWRRTWYKLANIYTSECEICEDKRILSSSGRKTLEKCETFHSLYSPLLQRGEACL